MTGFPPPDFSLFIHNGSLRYCLVVLLAACAAGLTGTWLSIRLARAWRAFDEPNARSSHNDPTPRLGGIGVAAGFMGVLLARWPLAKWLPESPASPAAAQILLAALAGGAVAFAFGLVDDLKGMRPWTKLAFQALCAGIAVGFGVRFQGMQLPGGPLIEFGLCGAALAFLRIMFFMNACNFMDGMDGHLGLFGVIACAGLLWPLAVIPDLFSGGSAKALSWTPALFLIPALAGALLGFLRFNLSSPAQTFMGDGGAQLTGFALAIMLAASPPAFVLPGFLALWPFIYDPVFTLVRRARRGENLMAPHREHLYQRLMRAGMSHRQSLAHSAWFQLACLAGAVYTVTPFPWRGGSALSWLGAAIASAATAAYTGIVWRREKIDQTRMESSHAS